MDINRPIWENLVLQAWKKRSIVWLAGVRRAGKTTLAKTLPNAEYLNCDLPSVRQSLEDPEQFLKQNKYPIIILDEIHQLPEASLILKIAADEFKQTKILATGSSTLIAGKKFKDTLTGRKKLIHFLPVLVDELPNFKINLNTRIFHGGLPPAMLSEKRDRDFYLEWMDSFYARDIQELFAIEKRQAFLQVLEFLLSQNGKLIELTKIAKVAGISRPTVVRYIEALEKTQAITVLRPYSKNSAQSIISQPKIYGFDTGFCLFAQGANDLRPSDCGDMLENLTLETIQSLPEERPIHFWRTKQGQEIDFILPVGRNEVHCLECKWQSKSFEPDHIEAFRKNTTGGLNIVVCHDVQKTLQKKIGQHHYVFVGIEYLRSYLMEILD